MLQWLLLLLLLLLLFQVAVAGFPGTISVHPPGHRLLQSHFWLQDLPKSSPILLDALTVFTDGSEGTGRLVIVWQDSQGQWMSDIHIVGQFPQIVEVGVVVWVFQKWSDPINIVTDSAYVTGIVTRIEAAYLKVVSNERLFALLYSL